MILPSLHALYSRHHVALDRVALRFTGERDAHLTATAQFCFRPQLMSVLDRPNDVTLDVGGIDGGIHKLAKIPLPCGQLNFILEVEHDLRALRLMTPGGSM